MDRRRPASASRGFHRPERHRDRDRSGHQPGLVGRGPAAPGCSHAPAGHRGGATGPRRPSSCSSTCASWWPSRRRRDQLNDALWRRPLPDGIVGYFMVFFAIWWAWVNFTWFASAYDVDDLLYRLLTFVQIIGVLILAAGVASAFTTATSPSSPSATSSCAWRWWPSGSGPPPVTPRHGRPPCATRWASPSAGRLGAAPVPAAAGGGCGLLRAGARRDARARVGRAGRARGGTPWHPGHISERYGLFTLIVLGECIAAATVAMHDASAVARVPPAWWRSSAGPCSSSSPSGGGTSSTRPRRGCACRAQLAFLWGYGHYFVFASVAALGAGLELAAAGTHGGEGTAPQRSGAGRRHTRGASSSS